MVPTAAVRLRVRGQALQGSGTGDGPVDAVYQTIAGLVGSHPKLTSYAIKAITGGTDAQGEVTVQMLVNGRTFTGRGAHTDIVVASAKAYIKALNRLETVHPAPGKKTKK